MKKVAFNRGVLEGYLQFFNCSLADLVGAISTEKTPETRRRKIEEDLKNGEAEFRILRKIAGKFRINIYNFFLGTFSENAFLVEFKGKNPTVSLSADTYHILRYYQNLREDIAVLDEGYENIGGSIVSRNQPPRDAAETYREKFGFDAFLANRPDSDAVFKFLREKIEFAHYLLNEPEIEISENFEKNKTERWCNRFAYSFLVPEHTEKVDTYLV